MDKASENELLADSTAQEIRRRYRYRQLLLRGPARLPRQAVVGLIGPDCAYHLYRWEKIRENDREDG